MNIFLIWIKYYKTYFQSWQRCDLKRLVLLICKETVCLFPHIACRIFTRSLFISLCFLLSFFLFNMWSDRQSRSWQVQVKADCPLSSNQKSLFLKWWWHDEKEKNHWTMSFIWWAIYLSIYLSMSIQCFPLCNFHRRFGDWQHTLTIKNLINATGEH